MPASIRTTVIMKTDDLGKIRKHKSDFLAQGYDLTMGQIIRLAIRSLQTGAIPSSTLEKLLGEDGRRRREFPPMKTRRPLVSGEGGQE